MKIIARVTRYCSITDQYLWKNISGKLSSPGALLAPISKVAFFYFFQRERIFKVSEINSLVAP